MKKVNLWILELLQEMLVMVEKISAGLKGWLFGDRGYISKKLTNKLIEKGLELITTLRKNMKKQFVAPIKKWWLRKRGIVETVFDQMKSILHLQHTRHRSKENFFTNILAALLAYVLKPKKPSISFNQNISNLVLISS